MKKREKNNIQIYYTNQKGPVKEPRLLDNYFFSSWNLADKLLQVSRYFS